MPLLEEMSDFFAARVEGYDEHMLTNVEGCREGYLEMAKHIPGNAERLLDLGCGTGLELDEIFRHFPDLAVTGVDLTPEMLTRLKEKHPDKALDLICGDYFTVEFPTSAFDVVISFETMHHFAKEKKQKLYQRIYNALAPNGIYIECDYMVNTQCEEDTLFAACEKLRREQGIPDGVFCHFDTPCTIENQKKLLNGASFSCVDEVFCMGNTVMLIARK